MKKGLIQTSQIFGNCGQAFMQIIQTYTVEIVEWATWVADESQCDITVRVTNNGVARVQFGDKKAIFVGNITAPSLELFAKSHTDAVVVAMYAAGLIKGYYEGELNGFQRASNLSNV